jgi:hypothetical protein
MVERSTTAMLTLSSDDWRRAIYTPRARTMSAEASGRTCTLSSTGKSVSISRLSQPRRDQPWMGGDDQHAGVLTVESQMIRSHLASAGRDQIDQGVGPQSQQSLVLAAFCIGRSFSFGVQRRFVAFGHVPRMGTTSVV